MRCAIAILILLCLPVSAGAQNSTRIIVTSFPDTAIREEVERNATMVLTSINYAYRHKQHPVIPEWAITPEGTQSIVMLWKEGAFYSPYTEIEASLEESTAQVLTIRNIRLFLAATEEQGNHLNREAYFELNLDGRISHLGFVPDEQ